MRPPKTDSYSTHTQKKINKKIKKSFFDACKVNNYQIN